MMTSVEGYYNGHNIVTNENITFNKGQRFIITILNQDDNDPFYSDENMAELKRRISDVKSGKSTLKEHDLIED